MNGENLNRLSVGSLLTSIGVLAFCVHLTLLANPPQQLSPARIAHLVLPSVAIVRVTSVDFEDMAIGSGFLVSDRDIVTNYHVVKNAYSIQVRFVDGVDTFYVRGVMGIDPTHDLVLLRLNQSPNRQALRVNDSRSVIIGAPVYVAGNPLGLEGTFSNGIVSAIRGEEYIQLTAPISPGSSGGPVVNDEGFVIGIASSQTREGQNLNFAIPSTHLLRLVANSRQMMPNSTLVPKPRCDGLYWSASLSKRYSADLKVIGLSHAFTYYRFFEDGTVIYIPSISLPWQELHPSWLTKKSASAGTLTVESQYTVIDDSTIVCASPSGNRIVGHFSGEDLRLEEYEGEWMSTQVLRFVRWHFP